MNILSKDLIGYDVFFFVSVVSMNTFDAQLDLYDLHQIFKRKKILNKILEEPTHSYVKPSKTFQQVKNNVLGTCRRVYVHYKT